MERTAVPSWDISGCIMEEESAYSAIWPAVKFTAYPAVAVADRAARSVAVRWTTDIASDSTVEYGAWNATYTNTYYSSALVTDHVATITGLEPNTMYHFRVRGAASLYKTGSTRDLVTCTINENPNLLVNPSFEDVPPPPPNHHRAISAPWYFAGIGTRAGDGSYFASIPPYVGSWFACPALNGAAVHGSAYQTVSAIPGVTYNFTAAIYTHLLEEDKKDVIPGTNPPVKAIYTKFKDWSFDRDVDYVRLGIDPTGGTDKTSANIVWSPAMYSYDHWTVVGIKATASASQVTVFVKMDIDSSYFHVYGIDDCRLSGAYPAVIPIATLKGSTPDGLATAGDLIITATPSQVGSYYAEDEHRTQGIRIESAQTAVLGSRVTVTGTLTTDPNTHERYLANAGFVGPTGDTAPEALEMQCKNLGGYAFGTLIPAVPNSVGLHNTGLLVKIAGVVTQVEAGYYIYVNDGSLASMGIRIITSGIDPASVPGVGQVVSVRGISALWFDGLDVKPVIRPRGATDLGGPYN